MSYASLVEEKNKKEKKMVVVSLVGVRHLPVISISLSRKLNGKTNS